MTLVFVLQRFAADWLNLLVPHGDPDYERVRGNLAIKNPIDLDGFYGVHPGMANLEPLFRDGTLGFVHATGWKPEEERNRSHFLMQGQCGMGSRDPSVVSGWGTRFMDQVGRDREIAALAAEPKLPEVFSNGVAPLVILDANSFYHGSPAGDKMTKQLQDMYAEHAGLSTVSHALEIMNLMRSLPPASGAGYPNTHLGKGLSAAAQIIKAGYKPRMIAVRATEGWDTHANQLATHNRIVPQFANALRAFHDEMGAGMDEVALFTLSEFGRKVVMGGESTGTDHGSGSAMMYMGGRLLGGQVLGRHPGLKTEDLYAGRDLEVTTDWRCVAAELCAFAGATDTNNLFAGGYGNPSNWLGLTERGQTTRRYGRAGGYG